MDDERLKQLRELFSAWLNQGFVVWLEVVCAAIYAAVLLLGCIAIAKLVLGFIW